MNDIKTLNRQMFLFSLVLGLSIFMFIFCFYINSLIISGMNLINIIIWSVNIYINRLRLKEIKQLGN